MKKMGFMAIKPPKRKLIQMRYEEFCDKFGIEHKERDLNDIHLPKPKKRPKNKRNKR